MVRSPWPRPSSLRSSWCYASRAEADPILVKGSFEPGPEPFPIHDIDIPSGSTAITGWLVTGGGIDLNEDPWDVSDGLRAIDLDGRNALAGGIQQTLATTIGQTYWVMFDLSGNPGDSPFNGLSVVKQVRVAVDGFTQDYSHDTTGQRIDSLIAAITPTPTILYALPLPA